MKILLVADQESKLYWDYFKKEYFEGIDLIISCGDLKAEYLSFLATMVPVPVLYVHGNHDYKYETKPPEGCICIDDTIFEYEGIRILGLGGSRRYKPGPFQYTEKEMKRRVCNFSMKRKLKKGVDIIVTHAPAYGLHDDVDVCHRGFDTFNQLIEKHQPRFFVHGHVHMNYGRQFPREDVVGNTRVINAYEKFIIEL